MPAAFAWDLRQLDDNEIIHPNDTDSSEAAYRLDAMRRQEEITHCNCFDYMKKNKNNLTCEDNSVDETCRFLMCQWCYRVIDACDLRRETVAYAMSYLDRFLCTKQGRCALLSRKSYQIVVMTALHISIKIHESVVLNATLLAKLSRGEFCEKLFEETEMIMLEALGWRLGGPTPLCFIKNYLALISEFAEPTTLDMIMIGAQHQAELAVFEYPSFVVRRPSEIALVAIRNAIMDMDHRQFPPHIKDDLYRVIDQSSVLTDNEFTASGKRKQLAFW